MSLIQLSCVKEDGTRCKPDSFSSRKRIPFSELPENITVRLKLKDIEDIDNGNIHEWYMVIVPSGVKGIASGKWMFCVKTNILRDTTEEEYYGNRTVD